MRDRDPMHRARFIAFVYLLPILVAYLMLASTCQPTLGLPF